RSRRRSSRRTTDRRLHWRRGLTDRRSRLGRPLRRLDALGGLWFGSRLSRKKPLVRSLALGPQRRQLHRPEEGGERRAPGLLPLRYRCARQGVERSARRTLVKAERRQPQLDFLLRGRRQTQRLLRVSRTDFRLPIPVRRRRRLGRRLPFHGLRGGWLSYAALQAREGGWLLQARDPVLRHLSEDAVGEGVEIGLIVGAQIRMLGGFPQKVFLGPAVASENRRQRRRRRRLRNLLRGLRIEQIVADQRSVDPGQLIVTRLLPHLGADTAHHRIDRHAGVKDMAQEGLGERAVLTGAAVEGRALGIAGEGDQRTARQIAVDPAQAPFADDRPRFGLRERGGERVVATGVEDYDIDAVLAFHLPENERDADRAEIEVRRTLEHDIGRNEVVLLVDRNAVPRIVDHR